MGKQIFGLLKDLLDRFPWKTALKDQGAQDNKLTPRTASSKVKNGPFWHTENHRRMAESQGGEVTPTLAQILKHREGQTRKRFCRKNIEILLKWERKGCQEKDQ